jgi:pilus assembly protein FimV
MMRKKLPADRAMGAQKSMERPQWRATALAIATAVLMGLSATDASALALGRVTVQSALGEPLRAEIDVPEITADELSSLRATIASPETFRAAGFDYNPAMGSIQVTLQRRPDGRHFLQLSSQRPVNDPFIDLILEASWSSGRIVRDYTMLFDPPNLRQSAPAVAAQVPPASTPAARAPAAAPAAQPGPPAAEATSRAPAASQPAILKPAAGQGKQVTVQSGDTAGRIAAANKPTSVSLDQMLVALLQANPQAFIRGNVNRLRAGAVLDVPTAEQAEAIPAGEARQTIIAQSRDFNDFRRRLAEGLPKTPIAGNERQASGRVQAQVEEKKPAAATPDKLTLSKGAVQGKGAPDKIARERAAQDDATRIAELNKNIADLNKLGSATGPVVASGKPGTVTSGIPTPAGIAAAKPASAPVAAAPAVPASVAKAPASAAVPVVAPAVAAPPAANTASATMAAANPPVSASGTAAAAASAAATAATASAPASVASTALASATAASAAAEPASAALAATAPALSASKPRVAPAPPPEPETSLVDDLLENPIVPASVGGVLALLLGFGFYRAQQRKKSTQVDSSFLESRLQPDSFFGASGGQRVDTNESSNATGSSMVYSPSQLDAAGDVDPVAEADVYLAYGRDLQAEEILKEAMRITPQRVAVHTKLLEIYAKRRDAKAFGQVASETYSLTRGEGPEWDHICELGRELDASNELYRPGGRPAHASAAVQGGGPAEEFGAQATQAVAVGAASESPVDLDLDLDFSIGDEPLETGSVEPAGEPVADAASLQSTQKMERPSAVEPMPSLDMDFGSASAAADTPALPVAASPHAVQLGAPDLKAAAAAKAAPVTDAGMIEFDLGALSLDLNTPPAAAAPVSRAPVMAVVDEGPVSTAGAPLSTGGLDGSGSGDDPLATKLALAQEFNAIGDPDGARSLAEEVLAAASGDLKQKAQRFLAEIA